MAFLTSCRRPPLDQNSTEPSFEMTPLTCWLSRFEVGLILQNHRGDFCGIGRAVELRVGGRGGDDRECGADERERKKDDGDLHDAKDRHVFLQ